MKSTRPDISVVVATCHREQMLLDCLNSVLAQDADNHEIIVVDQAAGSGLARLLAESFPGERRIRYRLADRAGASRARNLGVSEARAELVAFIDDDALAEPGWLAGMVSTLQGKGRPALVGGRIEPLWMCDPPRWLPSERMFLLGLYDPGGAAGPMRSTDFPVGANMAGRRDLVLAHGGFDDRLGPNYFRRFGRLTGEETILGHRIRRSGHTIFYQPDAVVKHCIGAGKLTRKAFLRRNFWDGVTTAFILNILGDVDEVRAPHIHHHVRDAAGAFLRATLPRPLGGLPRNEQRMGPWSHCAFECGLLYGLTQITKKANPVGAPCESA